MNEGRAEETEALRERDETTPRLQQRIVGQRYEIKGEGVHEVEDDAKPPQSPGEWAEKVKESSAENQKYQISDVSKQEMRYLNNPINPIIRESMVSW